MSMRQLPTREVEGQECLFVPIGKKGKKGNFLCDKASWDYFVELALSHRKLPQLALSNRKLPFFPFFPIGTKG